MRERKKPSQSWIARSKHEIENADRLLAERIEKVQEIRKKKNGNMENRQALRYQMADRYVGHPFETNESTTVTVARAAYRDGYAAAIKEVRNMALVIQDAVEAVERADHPAERELRELKLLDFKRAFDEFLNENC